MAEGVFAVLQFLHIASAAVLLGYFAFAPLLRATSANAPDPGIARYTVDVLKKALLWITFPAFVAVLASGIAMSFRSTSQGLYGLDMTWIRASLLMTLVLGVLLYGLLGPLRKMKPLLDAGEPRGAATDKLWSEWRTSLMMAGLLALVTTGLMIYNSWITA